jgi:NADPH2:quinone reductase
VDRKSYGFTACMLLRRVHAVRAGATLLIHAAAGGVGQPLVRWAKHLGATVIATVGSEKKAAVARECGADHVILRIPFPARSIAWAFSVRW